MNKPWYHDYEIESAGNSRKMLCWVILTILAVICFSLGFMVGMARAESVDVERLATAIYYAEGVNSRHPYGILAHYKHTTPRQACINTINSALKRWDSKGDFIEFLGRTYCPPDAHPLNKNWVHNVKYFYDRH